MTSQARDTGAGAERLRRIVLAAALTFRAGSRPEDVEVSFEDETLSIHAKVAQRQPPETEFLAREYGVAFAVLQASE